jgi:hypothetical protein
VNAESDDADDSGSVEEPEPKSDENTASETDEVTCDLEKVTVEEPEPKSDENTASETDKVTCDLEKVKVDEEETQANDEVAEASSNAVDNEKESTAAD